MGTMARRIDSYIRLRHSLGYAFKKQAGTLRAFLRYAQVRQHEGPLTQKMALDFIYSYGGTANGRAIRYAVLRRFAEYLAIYDSRTQSLDPRALHRSRAIPPPRILTDEELGSLMSASNRLSPKHPLRGRTLRTIIGLLASTGLRSGEALRLNRADVDLIEGVLHVRQTKFRKDRLVPVHATTLAALRRYAGYRDREFPEPQHSAFFLSLRGTRMSNFALCSGLRQACALAGLGETAKKLRPHSFRHRFAVARLVAWHRQDADVQALLPFLATYLGHARYTDTAYYITGTAELLALAAKRAFSSGVSS